MRVPLITALSIALPFILSAQQPPVNRNTYVDHVFSPGALSNVVNRKLNGLVSGQPNGTIIGNYAAFDPIGGSFTFKGTMAFDKHSDSNNITKDYFDKPAKVSFLSFKLQGDIVDGSYASLFSNSKLNTNASLELQYHFLIGKLPPIKIFGSEYLIAEAKKQAAFSELAAKRMLMDSNYLVIQRDYLTRMKNIARDSISIKQHELDSIIALLSGPSKNVPDSSGKWKKKADELMAFIDAAKTEEISKKIKIDSINNVLNDFAGYSVVAGNALAKEAVKKRWQIENNFSVVQLHFWWLTAIGGGSRMDYYTYDPTVPFSQGIVKQNMDAWKIGLAINYYSENNLKRVTYLINGGFKIYKDNNTSQFSTTGITQEVVTKNATGDTTRKISKQYNAYTDAIEEVQVVELFSNFYLLKGNRRGAIHIYPSYQHYYRGKGNYLNTGIGYLVSFINSKKDQPVINVEGYAELKDLTNYVKMENHFWKRAEIGIRFAVPFNLF